MSEQNPMMEACKVGDYDAVATLLPSVADIEFVNEKGWTPMHVAAFNDHAAIIELLFKYGAKLNPVSKQDATPLLLAVSSGSADCVKKLIELGAAIDKLSSWGSTLLYQAASFGHVEVVRSLLTSNTIDVNEMSYENITALWMASEIENLPIVQLLLAKGADCKTCDALYAAASFGHISVVTELLRHGADVNGCDLEDETPLYRAARGDHLLVVEELLKNNADPDKVLFDEGTPLCVAASSGYLDVVQALCRYGADVNKPCRQDEYTPLMYACDWGSEEIIKCLRRANGTYCNNHFEKSPLDLAMMHRLFN